MTTEITTTYVAYQYPGSLGESIKPIYARTPQQQANEAPDKAFAFFYFDIVTACVKVEGDIVEMASNRRNISKTYYVNAELLNYDTVRTLAGEHSTLLSNMRSNRWAVVVRCRTGDFLPFEPTRHELITTK